MGEVDSGARGVPEDSGETSSSKEKWECLPLLKEHRITSLRELEALYSPSEFEDRLGAPHGDFYFRGQQDAWRMRPSIWRRSFGSIPRVIDFWNFSKRKAEASRPWPFARHPRDDWESVPREDVAATKLAAEELLSTASTLLRLPRETIQSRVEAHVRWLGFESVLLRDFAWRCARAGLDCPDAERGHGFDTLGVLKTWPLVRPFELMSLAQHFGIPTRLLDFSRSFFAALHFALDPPSREQPSWVPTICLVRQGDSSFDKHGFNSYHGVSTTNRRLLAQRGLFLYLPMAEYDFYTHGKWPSLEDVVLRHCVQDSNKPPVVQRILLDLPADEQRRAHSRLAAFGAVGGDMFPEHERFADEVRRTHKLD